MNQSKGPQKEVSHCFLISRLPRRIAKQLPAHRPGARYDGIGRLSVGATNCRYTTDEAAECWS
jgi:hypothetical protein